MSFIQWEQQENEEEDIMNLKDIEKLQGNNKHFRIVDKWPIETNFQVVCVGEYKDKYVVHVNCGPDEYGGPGEFLQKRIYEIKFYNPEVYNRIADVLWEENGNIHSGKYNEMPPDTESIKEGIRPHHFVGQDIWK